MRIGTVMELENKSAVILTDDCDFVKIPRTEGMELGHRVSFAEKKKVLPFLLRNKKMVGVLIAACVMLGVLGVYFKLTPVYAEPYAYVTVDINPSIELAIDREYRVIGWSAFNTDGKSVMEKLHLKGEPIEKALKGIVNEARTQGFFKNYGVGSVLLTATPNTKYDDFNTHKKQVTEDLAKLVVKEEETLEKAEENKVNITSETLQPEVRDVAKKKNISAGRQYLINNAKKAGAKDITEEDIKKANITELLNKHGNQVLGEDAFKDYKADKERDPHWQKDKRKNDEMKNGEAGETRTEGEDLNWNKDGTKKNHFDMKNENEKNKIKIRGKKNKNGSDFSNINKDKIENPWKNVNKDKIKNGDKDKLKDKIKNKDKDKDKNKHKIKIKGKTENKDLIKNNDEDKKNHDKGHKKKIG